TFSNNTVTATASGGGAIAAHGGVSIGTSASPLASVTLTGNTAADFFGGAIYADATGVTGGPRRDVDNFRHRITLTGNTSGAAGGAIFAQDEFTLNADTITATGNRAATFGGALYANNHITINADTIMMSNNQVTPSPTAQGGGAIHLGGTGPAL